MNQTFQLKRTMTRILLAFILILAGYAGFAQSVDIRQAENGNTNNVGNVKWIESNLGSNNSVYYEGMAVPQRIITTNLPNQVTHTILLKHQAKKGTKHGYDFLISWEMAQFAAEKFRPSKPLLSNLNDYDDVPNNKQSAVNTILLSNATSGRITIVPPANITEQSVANRKSAFESLMNELNGGTPIPAGIEILSTSAVSAGSLEFLRCEGNDSSAVYTLSWTTASPSNSAIIKFAGHLASSVDFFTSSNYTPVDNIGWGASNGAGAISGSSFHINVKEVDGSSVGSQDNQITSVLSVDCSSFSLGTPTVTNVTCYGANNGSISLSVSGGTTPYSYSWTGTGVSGNTTSSISNLSPGTYEVTVVDGGGVGVCQRTGSFIITQPTDVTVSATGTNVTCNGEADGTISVSASDGTTLTISKDGGAYTAYSSTATYGPGSYVIKAVADGGNIGNKCEKLSTAVVITQPAQPLAASATTAPTECAGTKTGSITLTVSGGTALYQYKLNGGPLTNLSANGIIASLQAGNYTLYVQDAKGCNVTIQGNVTVAEGPVCYPYYTYSQGYYGNTNGNGVACIRGEGGLRTRLFIEKSLATGGGLKLGNSANTKYFEVPNNPLAIDKLLLIMPGGGTPNVLAGTSTLPDVASAQLKNGKINNVLLGQAVAMWLNINIPGNELGSFDLKGLKCKTTIVTKEASSSSSCNVPYAGTTEVSTVFPQSVVNALILRNKTTVKDLVTFASDALVQSNNKTYLNVSLSDINAALDAIVNAFHGGKYFARFAGSISGCTPPITSKINVTSPVEIASAIKVDEAKSLPSVTTFPNPYTDKITFRITAKESGKASLVLYNMVGQKIANVFEGNLQANSTSTIEYTIPFAQRKNLVYVFRQNDYSNTGKLISGK